MKSVNKKIPTVHQVDINLQTIQSSNNFQKPSRNHGRSNLQSHRVLKQSASTPSIQVMSTNVNAASHRNSLHNRPVLNIDLKHLSNNIGDKGSGIMAS